MHPSPWGCLGVTFKLPLIYRWLTRLWGHFSHPSRQPWNGTAKEPLFVRASAHSDMRWLLTIKLEEEDTDDDVLSRVVISFAHSHRSVNYSSRNASIDRITS